MDTLVAILAIISPIAALIFGYYAFNNSRKQIEQKEATDKTTILIKLENIGDNVKDIKSEVKDIKSDISGLNERVAKVEASCASAHKRLDGLSN